MHEPLRRAEATRPDAELVRAAVGGDKGAEQTLYLRHAQRVHRLALFLLANRPDAEELAQESFAAAFSRLHTLREPAAFGGWLRRIVIHRGQRVLKRRALGRRLGLVPATDIDLDAMLAVSTPPEVRAELAQVLEALDRWPTDERMAYCMQQLEGMSIEDIVAATGWSRATVNRRLLRARARIAEMQGGRRG